MVCKSCGFNNDSDALFCPNCGVRLGVQRCRICGTEMEPGDDFCSICGTRAENDKTLSAENTVPAVDKTLPAENTVPAVDKTLPAENVDSAAVRKLSAEQTVPVVDTTLPMEQTVPVVEESVSDKAVCPSCGKVIEAGADFCGECGFGLKTSIPFRKRGAPVPGGGYVAPPKEEPSEKRAVPKKNITIIIILVAVLILAAGGLTAYLLLKDNVQEQTAEPEQTTAVTEQPAEKPTKKPKATTAPTEKPTAAPTVIPTIVPTAPPSEGIEIRHSGRVVTAPSYIPYTTEAVNCCYPSHFEEFDDNDSFSLYSIKAPDNTAVMKICAYDKSGGLSADEVKDRFIRANPGRIDYTAGKEEQRIVRLLDNSKGIYHYLCVFVKENSISGFEMHFAKEYFDEYDKYINDIYQYMR